MPTEATLSARATAPLSLHNLPDDLLRKIGWTHLEVDSMASLACTDKRLHTALLADASPAQWERALRRDLPRGLKVPPSHGVPELRATLQRHLRAGRNLFGTAPLQVQRTPQQGRWVFIGLGEPSYDGHHWASVDVSGGPGFRSVRVVEETPRGDGPSSFVLNASPGRYHDQVTWRPGATSLAVLTRPLTESAAPTEIEVRSQALGAEPGAPWPVEQRWTLRGLDHPIKLAWSPSGRRLAAFDDSRLFLCDFGKADPFVQVVARTELAVWLSDNRLLIPWTGNPGALLLTAVEGGWETQPFGDFSVDDSTLRLTLQTDYRTAAFAAGSRVRIFDVASATVGAPEELEVPGKVRDVQYNPGRAPKELAIVSETPQGHHVSLFSESKPVASRLFPAAEDLKVGWLANGQALCVMTTLAADPAQAWRQRDNRQLRPFKVAAYDTKTLSPLRNLSGGHRYVRGFGDDWSLQMEDCGSKLRVEEVMTHDDPESPHRSHTEVIDLSFVNPRS